MRCAHAIMRRPGLNLVDPRASITGFAGVSAKSRRLGFDLAPSSYEDMVQLIQPNLYISKVARGETCISSWVHNISAIREVWK
jgi:hypothetical protein